ncbi:MAG TPA: hypothetical protein VGM36_02525 [Rhizomicrobium sp.]|jgi:hypothetical protein
MDRIPRATDLTLPEMMCLREIVIGNFTSMATVSVANRKRLIELGLIQSAMGGLMATPAGRMVARV